MNNFLFVYLCYARSSPYAGKLDV